MSPEQAAGERTLDARSDVYSLGCVLYEMLAGEPPYTGPTAQAVIAKRFTDPGPAVRRLRPTVPASVEQAIMRALARVPADRFATAAAFAEALTRAGLDTARAPSVAVLPFRNLSADPENEFFADGITEDVIAQLSKIRSLKVISRGSVMRVQEAGAEPAGDRRRRWTSTTLLEGSVRRAGSRVRIVAAADRRRDRPASLGGDLRPRADRHLRHPERRRAPDRRSARGRALARRSDAGSGRQPTDDVQAYQLVPPGTALRVPLDPGGGGPGPQAPRGGGRPRSELRAGIRRHGLHLHRASGSAWRGRSRRTRRLVAPRRAVTRALEIDPGLAEAHAALGYLKYVCDYDWAGAEAELKRAIELNPNSGDASTTIYGLHAVGARALRRGDRGAASARTSSTRWRTAWTWRRRYLRAGRYDEALRRHPASRRESTRTSPWRTPPSDGPTC